MLKLIFLPLESRDEYRGDADRRDKAAYPEPRLVELEFQLAAVAYLVERALRPNPADEDGDEDSAYRHYRVVRDEVERVEEVLAEDLRNMSADGKRGGNAEQRDGGAHRKRGLRAVPVQLVDREGYDDLKERYA